MRLKLFVRDDRGIALASSLAVSLVVSLLAVAVVSLSSHNVGRSANNRERVQSVAAAEAGLNRMYAHLETATPATLACSLSETMTTDAKSSFVASLYVENGTGGVVPLTCPPAAVPSRVLVRSIGRGVGPAPERVLESLVNLVPRRAGLFGGEAIFSNQDLVIDSNVQVEGNEGGDANVYSNGKIELRSDVVVAGSAYAQATILLNSNTDVKKDAWAMRDVTLDSTAIVRRNVTSSVSGVSVASNAHVYGDARAGTTIVVSGTGAIDGLRLTYSPSASPPAKPFPTFTYNSADWTALGYSIQSFTSCASAKSFIEGISSGRWVVRITASCELSWNNTEEVNVRGNLAIVHDGSISMSSNSRFTSVGGPHDLFLFAGLGTGSCNFETRSNSSIGSGLNTLIYSPCQVNLRSNSFVMQGQIFAGQAYLRSNTKLTYRPVSGPGGAISGYMVEPLYTREVKGS